MHRLSTRKPNQKKYMVAGFVLLLILSHFTDLFEKDPVAKIPNIKPPTDKPNPKVGIHQMSWSANGKYLASKNGINPQP